MTPAAGVAAPGNVHDAGLYGSDDEFVELVVPFVEEGLAADEPVVTGYDPRKAALLRDALGDTRGLTFIEDDVLYATPSRAISSYRALFAHHVAMGARRIRVAGDVPHAGNGGNFEGWDRYECAVNTVWDDYPVFSLCLYDTRIAPRAVLNTVARTHRHIITPHDGRTMNNRYEPPELFTPEPPAIDPLEHTRPDVELIDPSPGMARAQLAALVATTVHPTTVDDLVLSVSELVTNGHIHGRAPVTVRFWTTAHQVMVVVHDTGAGPRDPIAGLRQPAASESVGGRGLWIAHQVCEDIALRSDADGFTVRLRAPLIQAPPPS